MRSCHALAAVMIFVALSASAHATPISSSCGAVVSSVAKTEALPITIRALAFADLPGAEAAFTIRRVEADA